VKGEILLLVKPATEHWSCIPLSRCASIHQSGSSSCNHSLHTQNINNPHNKYRESKHNANK